MLVFAVIPEKQQTAPQLVLGAVSHLLLCAAGLLPVLQWHLTVTYLSVCLGSLSLCAFVPLSSEHLHNLILFPSLPSFCLFPHLSPEPHQAAALALRGNAA